MSNYFAPPTPRLLPRSQSYAHSFSPQFSPFAPKPPPSPPLPKTVKLDEKTPRALTLEAKSSLESALPSSLLTRQTDEAWKSFKTLTSSSHFPPPQLCNSLILHLSSLNDRLNALASTIFLIEKYPKSISLETLKALFETFNSSNSAAPGFALIKTMLKNRLFPPFTIWGLDLLQISRRNGLFGAFLQVFEENCRICLDEKVHEMRPDLGSCNRVFDGCCRELGSVSDAEKVMEIISSLGLSPNSDSFGSLAYLYAWRGHASRILELDQLIDALGFKDKVLFFKNLISGYVRSGKFESVSKVIVRGTQEQSNEDYETFGEETYVEIVKGFIENGRIKDLASLIIKTQELESRKPVGVDSSLGFGMLGKNSGLSRFVKLR